MASHALVIVELEVKEHERLKPLAQAVVMSTILYLPISTKSRTQTPLQESEAKETGICCSQTERIAHDLKNCMSVLLLATTSLKGNVDQPLISPSRRRVLEDVVGEMNHLVDEMVRLVESQGNK